MRIGIITFHWATNYGAVLQSFALQKYLGILGHDVKIINYKPVQFENNLWTFLRYRKFLNPKEFIYSILKENKMELFRSNYLHLTERYYKKSELNNCVDFDALITGSDQVLNPSFLEYGENGKCTSYFLDFGNSEIIRVSYAASFGTTIYPEHLISQITPIIKKINFLSVRESTGVDICKKMGRKDAIVAPDPTILLSLDDYKSILNLDLTKEKKYFVYMIHNRLYKIKKQLPNNVVISKYESVEDWLSNIICAKGTITNSFHCVIFSIISHTPFLVVLDKIENIGMNDRFYTLLTNLGLENRIILENNFDIIKMDQPIDWHKVDSKLESYKKIGINFLSSILNN